MATAAGAYEGKNPEWKRLAMTGSLPEDFLCISPTPEQQQVANDYMAAVQMQKRANTRYATMVTGGRLTVGVISARLAKNYGMTRMDPYVRIRVGHSVFETHTDISGSRTPRWEKAIHCHLPPGIDMMHVEIFDECSFTADELIAWAYIPIPRAVLDEGKTVDEWFALSGKQGEDQEGHINLVLSYSAVPMPVAGGFPVVQGVPGQVYPYQVVAPPMVVPGAFVAAPIPPVSANQQRTPVERPAVVSSVPAVPELTAEDLKEYKDMFPGIDAAVILTAHENCRGNKDRVVNMLLELAN